MNNAGLFPQQFNITKDNMECYLQGNLTGHVLLIYLVLLIKVLILKMILILKNYMILKNQK